MNKALKYSLVGVGVLGTTFLVLYLANKGKSDEELPPDPQDVPDPILKEAVVESTTIGMKVYSKVDNVKIRKEPQVNDGLLNNVYDVVPNKNTFVGIIRNTRLSHQRDKINPATKKPYVWFSIELDKNLYQQMQKNRSWYEKDAFMNIPPPNKIWIREDVVYGKK